MKVAVLTCSIPRSLRTNRNTRDLKVVMLTGYIRIRRFSVFFVKFGCASISCRVGLRACGFGLKWSKLTELKFTMTRYTFIGP